MFEAMINPNSSATSHHSWVEAGCLCWTVPAMLSMIQPATFGAAAATSEMRTRNPNPSATTHGPESQTMRRTGGTFLRASRRSAHAEKKELCFSFAMLSDKVRVYGSQLQDGFYSRDARGDFCF